MTTHKEQNEERECANGHKGKGFGFEEGCPKCGASWKKQKCCEHKHSVYVCDCPCHKEQNSLESAKEKLCPKCEKRAVINKKIGYCHECKLLIQKEYRHGNKEKILKYLRDWKRNHLEKTNEYKVTTRARYREQALSHYGALCKCCGEDDVRFLCFDHINGGGNKHKKSVKFGSLSSWLATHNFPDGFQTLCYNCNMAKHIYKVCPHKDTQKIKLSSKTREEEREREVEKMKMVIKYLEKGLGFNKGSMNDSLFQKLKTDLLSALNNK